MCRLFGIIKKKKINSLERILLSKNIINSYIRNNRDGFGFYYDGGSYRTLDFKEFLKKFDKVNSKKMIIHLRYSTNIVNEKAIHFAIINSNNFTATIGHNGVFFNKMKIKEILKKLKKRRKKDKKLSNLIKTIEKEATLENDTYLFLLLVLYYLKDYNNITTKDIKETLEKINKKYDLGYGVVYLEINSNIFLISINKEMYLVEHRDCIYFNSNNDVNETLETKEITLKETIKEIKKGGLFSIFATTKERIIKEKLIINKDLFNSIKIDGLKEYNNCIIKIENVKIKEIEKLDFLKEEVSYHSIYDYDVERDLNKSYVPIKYRIKDIIEGL